jgi:hypothetical protein
MPFVGVVHLLIAIGLAHHAHRTGRQQFWMYILLFLPLVGSVAYVLFEILPDLANTRRGRKVARDIHTIIDPDRDWRLLSAEVAERGTIEAKMNLAEECERKGMWADAIVMYRSAAVGMFADDPDLLRGMARAELGSGDAAGAVATLDKLRAAHPDYQSQDAHMTYARALEAQDRLREAEGEYRALSAYFIGLEARTRHALVLLRMGEPAAAKVLFADIVHASKARGIVLSDEDREWVRVARRNLD